MNEEAGLLRHRDLKFETAAHHPCSKADGCRNSSVAAALKQGHGGDGY